MFINSQAESPAIGLVCQAASDGHLLSKHLELLCASLKQNRPSQADKRHLGELVSRNQEQISLRYS